MAIKKKPVEKKKSVPAKKAAKSGSASGKPVKASKAVPASKKATKTAVSTPKPTLPAKPKAAAKNTKTVSTAKKATVTKTTPAKKATAKKTATPVKKTEAPKSKTATVKKPAAVQKTAPPKTTKKTAAPVKEIKAAPVRETRSAAEEPKVRKTPAKATETNSRFVYRPEPSILDTPDDQSGPRRRYSDTDLQEFKDLIQRKLESARKELVYLQGLITRKDEAGTDDTENKYMGVEDGSGTMEREQLSQLASRQIQYIDHLEKALVRIENKTYGICRVTGKLIDKARLRAVPHATLSIEAKLANKK